MGPSSPIERVVLVVLDGLRAEAVRRLRLPELNRLMSEGAWTLSAQTVLPSVTSAALTSLITGVPPETHRIGAHGFGFPPGASRLQPITRLLSDAGLPSSAFLREIPFQYRFLASRLAKSASMETASFRGTSSVEIVDSATAHLRRFRPGFTFTHWPEADVAGHAHGWHSPAYEAALSQMDASLAVLTRLLQMNERPGTVLIACSDHGGGGAVERDHNSLHPEDTTIPIIIAGHGVERQDLGSGIRLLDLPPTILWALGVRLPDSYEGRPLQEAFMHEARAA